MSEIRVDTISEKTSANGVAVDGVTLKDGGIAATAGSTITTADNTDTLTLVSTDTDATQGPVLNLYRNSSSPADDDDIARINFTGNDSGGNVTTYATIRAVIGDVTDGSEDMQILHQQIIGGTNVNTIRIKPDEIVLNDSSIDLDFRVESNGNANMLFVDGGNDKVGIGTASPAKTLHISSADNQPLRVESTDAYSGVELKDNGASTLPPLISGLSDGFKIYAGHGSSRPEVMSIDATGAVTKPLQPAFKAVPSSQQNNLSVNAWNTIVFGTETYDINSDFGNSNFTAPVTGKYILTVNLYLQDIDSAATSITCELHTSNDDYPVFVTLPGVDFSADMGYRAFNGAVLVDMDANDTAAVRVYPEGGAAQTDVNISSTYSGMLIG
jgi:prepilin-type processing-associated H-X9-DG protein